MDRKELSGTGEAKGNSEKMNRRQFIEFAGLAAAGLFLPRDLRDLEPALRNLPEKGIPEIVHGVPVYGLKESIGFSELDMLRKTFEKAFDERHSDLVGLDMDEKRRKGLDPSKRYLEVVTTKGAVQKYESVREGRFVEALKQAENIVNLCLEDSNPTVMIRAELKRVIIINDGSKPETLAPQNSDIDHSTFIARDTKFVQADPLVDSTDIKTLAGQGNYQKGHCWRFADENGSIVFNRTNPNTRDRETKHPHTQVDFLTAASGIVDFGWLHEEYLHKLLNVGDGYIQDSYGRKFGRRFDFRFATGSFTGPRWTPDMAVELNRVYEKRIRGISGRGGISNNGTYEEDSQIPAWNAEIPKKCEIVVMENGVPLKAGIRVRRAEQRGDYYSPKSFQMFPDQEARQQDRIILSGDSLSERMVKGKVYYPLGWSIDAGDRELYLPAVLLNMSKVAGEMERVSFTIDFTGNDSPVVLAQELHLVDGSEMEDFTMRCVEEGDLIYAKTKVPGMEDTYGVWVLPDSARVEINKNESPEPAPENSVSALLKPKNNKQYK